MSTDIGYIALIVGTSVVVFLDSQRKQGEGATDNACRAGGYGCPGARDRIARAYT